MLVVNPDEGTITLFIPEPPVLSSFYSREYIRFLLGALLMLVLHIPVILVPGILVIVLPFSIYLFEKLDDELESFRTKRSDKLAHLEYWEQSSDRTERARTDALSARRVSDGSR